MKEHPDLSPDQRAVVRHLVATIAFRANVAIRDAPEGFGAFEPGDNTSTPQKILRHINQLLAMILKMTVNPPDAPEIAGRGEWNTEVSLFGRRLRTLDGQLASGCELEGAAFEQLLHGPLADALTHVGQLAMLRRLFGSPVQPVNFFKADIQAGEFCQEG